MEKHDKVVLVGALVAASFLLYMIKPAPANAFCSDWGDNLFHRSLDLEDKLKILDDIYYRALNQDGGFDRGYLYEYNSLQRDSLLHTIACSDITMFY